MTCQKEFLLFYMCQLWALHVVTKRQFFTFIVDNARDISRGMGVRKISRISKDLQGHSRSLVLLSFDNSTLTSYWSSIAIMSLSFTISAIISLIIRPIAIAYSMGQIIKSFCVCACVRACVPHFPAKNPILGRE